MALENAGSFAFLSGFSPALKHSRARRLHLVSRGDRRQKFDLTYSFLGILRPITRGKVVINAFASMSFSSSAASPPNSTVVVSCGRQVVVGFCYFGLISTLALLGSPFPIGVGTVYIVRLCLLCAAG